MGELAGLVRAFAHPNDELRKIAGPGCPYTLPLGGRPLIERAIKAVCDTGANRILVVLDASIADAVAPAVEEPKGSEVRVTIQPDGDDEATARAVERALGGGPVVFAAGDSLFTEPARARLEPGGETVIEMKAAWHYDGTVDGVLDGNTIALDGLERGRAGVDLASSSVQGRVYVDPTAEVSGAKLRGPVYIGPGARIVETYVGPYTSIGAGVTLEGVEIEHSIVLPGAQIRYPGRRLEASLVGEGAEIGRDYSLPSALRLRVGPGSQIQLS